MKSILLVIMLLFTALNSMSQGFFNQKGAQLKRLAEQIAALNAYKGVLIKGYSIIKGGMQTIGDLKKGDVNLHSTFFGNLAAVNPRIKNWSKVPDIVSYQLAILKIYQGTYKAIKDSKMYSEKELLYVYRVFGRLLDECEDAINDLMDLVTDRTLALKDNERIERIEVLHADMQERYQLIQAFSRESLELGKARLREVKEIKTSKQILVMN